MTELDFTILAIVARDGPLSAYDIRKIFARSLTSTWSSSTGSIHPSIRRLQNIGHLASSSPKGGRACKALSVTPSGRAALNPWLEKITPEVAGPTSNPVRTRMYFLGMLSSAKRLAIIGRHSRRRGWASRPLNKDGLSARLPVSAMRSSIS
jgi:DNA-binding PadR family transcriptional regulator